MTAVKIGGYFVAVGVAFIAGVIAGLVGLADLILPDPTDL